MLQRFAACILTATFAGQLIAADGSTIPVQLGKTIERTLAQAEKAHYDYGPRQAYDSAKKETHVFLPYGNLASVTSGARNANFSESERGSQAEVYTMDNMRAMRFQYRLEFDRPISSFHCLIGPYTELVLAPSGIAGVEYSTDGTTWAPVGEPHKGTRAVLNPLVGPDVVISDLDTRLLLLRIYTRDGDHPEADGGVELFLKMRISGDPSWGDAATTFFRCQNQVWVTTKK